MALSQSAEATGSLFAELESRPLRTESWRYRFYLNFDGHQHDPQIQQALQELKQNAVKLRVLGSYSQGLSLPIDSPE